jgi:hypothetical protein
MILNNRSKVFAAVTMLASLSCSALAAPRRSTTTTDDYRAQYDKRRDVYCIKFFADLPAAMPQPGPSRDICKSRTAWAIEGIQVNQGGRVKPL